MHLRIDPAIPLVWRTPHTLQLGGVRPLVVLDDPGELEHGVLALLQRGVERETLGMICAAIGTGPAGLDALLRRLEPALLPAAPTAARTMIATGHPDAHAGTQPVAASGDEPAVAGPPQGGRAARAPLVVVDGDLELGTAVGAAMARLGHRVVAAGSAPSNARVAFAVLAAQWVVPPALHLSWLRRDVPHLSVVHEGDAVRIGPLVEPGATGCLRCIELHRRDADAAWPVVAAQLANIPAPELDPRTLALVAAHAAALADERLALGRTAFGETSLSVPTTTALPSAAQHPPHPECGCRSLAGTATAPGLRDGPGRGGPSSTPVAAVPA